MRVVNNPAARIPKQMWKPPRAKAFAPEGVTVGTWVDWGYGTGQVWAASRGGKHPMWWVADGAEYHEVHESFMTVVQQATDEAFPYEMEMAA